MAKVYYVHWHEGEWQARVAVLSAAGHEVRGHWSAGETPRLGDELPDALVISLDRLPSHGRQIARWFWEARKRQTIPILFTGGKPDKVSVAREQFPQALFCTVGEVATVLARL
jgi:hypothetical protein